MELAKAWRSAFTTVVQQPLYAEPLKRAARQGKAAWTHHITAAVVAACETLGWEAAAIGHKGKTLPKSKSEYLSIDVMAFAPDKQKWSFPVAVFELENQQDDDYIAYDLWKLLCVRSNLRVLYCYRAHGRDIINLKQLLVNEVIGAMPVQERLTLPGSTLVVVGTYSTRDEFPYGYFKWWKLEKNTGKFRTL